MNGNGAKKTERSRGKYQPVLTDENQGETDTTPLLSAMELTGNNRSTKDSVENKNTDVTYGVTDINKSDRETAERCRDQEDKHSNGHVTAIDGDEMDKVTVEVGAIEIQDPVHSVEPEEDGADTLEDTEKVVELCKNVINSTEHQGAKPKMTLRKTCSEQAMPTQLVDAGKPEIDIVRKMSESSASPYHPWQLIGSYYELKQKTCRRLFAQTGRSDDLALFFHNGKFYALEAWCTHMGESSDNVYLLKLERLAILLCVPLVLN